MFDLSFGELLLLAAVAVIFIGPKELPHVLRAAARALGHVRALASEFRAAFDDLAQESGLKQAQAEMEREIKTITGDDGKTYEAYDISDFLPPYASSVRAGSPPPPPQAGGLKHKSSAQAEGVEIKSPRLRGDLGGKPAAEEVKKKANHDR